MLPSSLKKLSRGMPLLVTVVVHLLLIGVAAVVVVQQNTIGKKKTFEAANADASAPKAVEHRLQIARRGGASGGAQSPVFANRIVSTANNAIAMPEMPELPSMGASGFGGFGGMGSGVGLGAGAGMSTSLGGGTGLGGRGFISLSFLGMTNAQAKNVVFMIDISSGLMDIRKGGFQAFARLREEITRLVAAMPSAASFNVVFFEQHQVRFFASELQPATSPNKTKFFGWIKDVNSDINRLGIQSIPDESPRWTYTPNDSLKLDENYHPAEWVQAIHAALQLKADTIFLITGSGFPGAKKASASEMAQKRKQREQAMKELQAQGLDLDAVNAARRAALEKARAQFDTMNRELIQKNKEPFVIGGNTRRLLEPDFQAAIKRAGYTITVDTAGWTDKKGALIWHDFTFALSDRSVAEFSDAVLHVSRLQAGILPKSASLNIFLFTGGEDQQQGEAKNLASLAGKNGGKFTLLTAKKIEDLAAKNLAKK